MPRLLKFRMYQHYKNKGKINKYGKPCVDVIPVEDTEVSCGVYSQYIDITDKKEGV